MAKKAKDIAVKQQKSPEQGDSLFGNSARVDSALASLFSANAIPQTPIQTKTRQTKDAEGKQPAPALAKSLDSSSNESEEDERSNSESIAHTESSDKSSDDDQGDASSSSEEEADDASASQPKEPPESKPLVGKLAIPQESTTKSRRKRKRDDEDLESKYLDKLAKEEEIEEAKRAADRQTKRPKALQNTEMPKIGINGADTSSDIEMADGDDEDFEVPQHESLAKSPDDEIERANRTVFLGNVSSDAVTLKKAKKALVQHMSSILDNLPKGDVTHKVESLRFRSTAYTNMLPKKASFVTQDLMDSTTKSTNAYVVYSTKVASREALKLNGTMVLDRHLRVDSVAHPAKTDHKRCVFVGNLGFVDDESAIQAAEAAAKDKKARKKAPSDIEEGLWRQFGKCGIVENVRVVRDSKTRVGKGIAYVQFVDENAVEAALQYDGKRFPPMLPRKLRVSRAKGIKRNAAKKDARAKPAANGIYNPKINEQQKSAIGRASKLLGKAGANKISQSDAVPSRMKTPSEQAGLKTPESFVFEGHRATKGSAVGGRKKSIKKKMGRPDNRSTRRAKAWRVGGDDSK